MKKIFFVIAFSLLLQQAYSQTAGSQTTQSQTTGVRFGLTLSPQLSWMTAADKNLKGNGSIFGYEYGLLMDVLIPRNYAFSTGLLFNGSGGKLTYINPTQFNTFGDSTFAAGTNVDYHLQYITIPLTLKLRTNQIGYITYFGQFGFRAGINIRSRADMSDLSGATLDNKIDFGKDVNPFDFGLLVGGGFDYAIAGNTELHVALQYYNGFLDVTDNPKNYETKSTLGAIKLELGVFF